MALLANKTAEFGVQATYWSSDQVNIHWDAGVNNNAHVELMGYRSEQHKKIDNERYVDKFMYEFTHDNFPFTKGGNNEAEFYMWLKAEAQKPENTEEKYTLFTNAPDA
jgi:hypothetical protein